MHQSHEAQLATYAEGMRDLGWDGDADQWEQSIRDLAHSDRRDALDDMGMELHAMQRRADQEDESHDEDGHYVHPINRHPPASNLATE